MNKFDDIVAGKPRIIKHKDFLLNITPKRDKLRLRVGVDYIGKRLFIRLAIGYKGLKKIPLNKVHLINTKKISSDLALLTQTEANNA